MVPAPGAPPAVRFVLLLSGPFSLRSSSHAASYDKMVAWVEEPAKNRLPQGRNRERRESATRPIVGPRASSSRPRNRYAVLAVCSLLLLAIITVYGQTARHDFVNFDDDEYVCENWHVLQGLNGGSIAWAFTTFHACNWHPLTWLSHMLDCQLYGLKHPGGHHRTNVLLHTASVILLFLVLRRMTGDLEPSAFVASLFAIHPLHVESVAWVAERKDVLSGLFFMLTLAAYVGYVRRPFSLLRYLAVTVLFALGLMAKPILVTLPLVLLLLDYWPLGRFRAGCSCDSHPSVRVTPSTGPPHPRRTRRRGVLLEKLPWLGMTAACCMVTELAQQGAIRAPGMLAALIENRQCRVFAR